MSEEYIKCEKCGGTGACKRCGGMGEHAPSKKVRVRIAVAVGTKSDWNARGWWNKDADVIDDDLRDIALEGIDEGLAKIYWLEAELDIPTDEENVVKPVITGEETINE